MSEDKGTADAGGVIQADREAAADVVKSYRQARSDGDWQGRIRRGEADDGAIAHHRLAHTPGFDAARDRAVEALGKAFRFIDGVAGQELSYTGKDGITLESQDICSELCAAFGVDLNEDWPVAALAAIQPQGERGEGVPS